MSATTLKRIALVLMVIDHVGAFVPGMPIWLRWIGRCSAPIFLYVFCYSIDYTSNYTLFKKRIYSASIIMAVINLIYGFLSMDVLAVPPNMFATFFALCVLVELIKKIISKEDGYVKSLFIYISWQLGTALFAIMISYIEAYFGIFFDGGLPYFIGVITGNIFIVEGRIFWIILGVVIYFTKDNKRILALSYLVLSMGYSILSVIQFGPRLAVRIEHLIGGNIGFFVSQLIVSVYMGFDIFGTDGNFLGQCCQWMMIFALPILLLYNNKRGDGSKKFYYLFYPLHLLGFYIYALIV